MIVGTAGHIDHGKTSLVRALTGVDTDRLPEEKARGISIELGYAFMDLPSPSGTLADAPRVAERRLGFIDVPGHERLVHTMLAGATGIDFGLLLVAADDGVMPQTREHLAVLSLLGITRGAVAITKIDRVVESRVESVRADVARLLTGTSLADAVVVAVSARTQQGVPELRRLLIEAAFAGTRQRVEGAMFRLAVDRSFTLAGVGTVVTGTVHAGSVKIGDELAIAPSPNGLRGRVRSLHAQNSVVEAAHVGQRCAIALAGLAKDEVGRGSWLVPPGAEVGSNRFDALIELWHGEEKSLRSGTPVHVHIGASDTLATAAVLQVLTPSNSPLADALSPGGTAFVQIVLREPVAAWRGDRVVLRDASSSRTIAGGTVLDPFAPARYRRTPQRLAELTAWSLPSPSERLRRLLDVSPHGISLTRWLQAEGLHAGAVPPLPEDTLTASDKVLGDWLLASGHVENVAQAVLAALAAFHIAEPAVLGLDSARLRRASSPRLPEPLWRALLASLRSRGLVLVQGAFVHRPEHGVRLSSVDQRLAEKIKPFLDGAGYEGSWARDLARDANESEPLMRTTLARLAQSGTVHQVAKDLFYSDAAVCRLAALIRQAVRPPAGALTGAGDDADAAAVADAAGEITAARFRDATGLGRKRAIQLLEFFDRVGLLRRVGDAHRLRTDTDLFAPKQP